MLAFLMRTCVLGQTKKLAYPLSHWMAKTDDLKRLAGQDQPSKAVPAASSLEFRELAEFGDIQSGDSPGYRENQKWALLAALTFSAFITWVAVPVSLSLKQGRRDGRC